MSDKYCRRVSAAIAGSFFLLVLLVPKAALPAGEDLVITVLGDSLAAGYGLPADEAFPAQLERALGRSGLETKVINAGVSGDTTTGGLARLDWVLRSEPDLMIVELGANDALRALDPAQTEQNLEAILAALQKREIPVLLTGMRAPRNLGTDFVRHFEGLFPRLAQKYRVAYYPFFLEGVAGEPELNQADGLHPNSRGVAEIVRRLAPQVHSLVEAILADREDTSRLSGSDPE